MKKITFFLLSLLLILFNGCDQNRDADIPELQSDEVQVEKPQTAYAKALDNAFDLMQELYPEKHRTLLSRKHLLKPEYYTTATYAAAYPEAMGRMMAKSQNGEEFPLDTLLYIVNFGNDEGFAVIYAGDDTENNILAITESGSLTLEDLTRNYSDSPIGDYDPLPGATMAPA